MLKGLMRHYDRGVQYLLAVVAGTSILILLLIFLFLFKEGYGVFAHTGIFDFVSGTRWMPDAEPPQFGALPMIVGSLLVTIGAGTLEIGRASCRERV